MRGHLYCAVAYPPYSIFHNSRDVGIVGGTTAEVALSSEVVEDEACRFASRSKVAVARMPMRYSWMDARR